MDHINLSRKSKNEYLRFLVNILHKKYHVNISSLGRDIGIQDTYFRSFAAGVKNFSEQNLDKTEDYLIEMYGALLDVELMLHSPYIQKLKDDYDNESEQLKLFK